MASLTERSARKELRAVVERALAKEVELSDAARKRVVNRILRQSGRIGEIGGALAGPVAKISAAPVKIAEIEPEQDAFDPYAIGAVVTLQRLGADALLERLSGIKSVDNLRSLAVAQNLALKADCSTADQLRMAIVRSAEQRLAERRAAAS